MKSNSAAQDASTTTAWRWLGLWPTIVAVSIVLLILTLNPLLTAFFPYVRAGWPSLKTAFWLKKTDPWKARATVGFLFHLCMAFFCAGTCALVCVICTAVIAGVIQKEPDLIPFMIAILTIALGCFFSTILSWFGVAIALRHGVRVFVVSNLHDACRGDFMSAATFGSDRYPVNPANYIIGVGTAVPMLAIWFIAMLATVPGHWQNQNEWAPFILLGILPLLGILCIVIIVLLSMRVAARSPSECWAPEAPNLPCTASNWYQPID